MPGFLAWLARLLKPKPRPAPNPAPTPSPVPSPPWNPDDLIAALNAERRALGLFSLRDDPRLMAVAQAWAESMARAGVLSHGDSIRRIASVVPGATREGENVAEGYATVQAVVKGWMNSSGHRANIYGDYNIVGVGRAVAGNGDVYWVADMAKITTS